MPLRLSRATPAPALPLRLRWLRGLNRALDSVARRCGRQPRQLAIHALGARGEELAHWHLRACGYTIVARNYRHPARSGEIDLIAWDGLVLVFVEVKTRTEARGALPAGAVGPFNQAAERAVTLEKRRHLIALARIYLRRQAHRRSTPPYRFDVVAIYGAETPHPEIVLHRDAFRDHPEAGI